MKRALQIIAAALEGYPDDPEGRMKVARFIELDLLREGYTIVKRDADPPFDRETSQFLRITDLETALRGCAMKLERCAMISGTAPEFAAIVVQEYRNLLK